MKIAIIEQTKKYSIAVSALAVSLFSFSALATSPVHPDGLNQNMITSQTYSTANYQAHEESKMYPAPAEGMEQHILTLPSLDDEQNYMVEIQIGQTKMVDCNKHGLSGELTQDSVKGWGYQFYKVNQITDGPSTMMACLELAKKEAFLQIPGDLKINYDSRLPKVFYLPKGSEIRYRVWRVESGFNTSKLNAQ